MMSIRAIGLIGFSVFGLAALPVHAEQIIKTEQQGTVKAELSYEKVFTDGIPQTQNVRLKIQRAGQSVFDQAPTVNEYDRPLVEFLGDDKNDRGFLVRDLNGDKEPEVIADMYTGGAHCCRYSLIYSYDRDRNQYVELRQDWRDLGYRLRDLDRDGKTEFYSADARFAYAFASFAGSTFPIQIWRFENGKMVDVTRQYPKEIYSDAYRQWQIYQRVKADGEVKGVLAAYMADKYLLGQQADGWRQLETVYQDSDREEFFAQLRKFLKDANYAQ